MPTNSYANKPFLTNSMTQMLAYGSNNAFGGTVTQSGTTLTITSLTSGTVAVGSLIEINGALPVSVYANISGSGSGSTWTVNRSQTVVAVPPALGASATASSYTVQNLLNTFLNGVDEKNYNLLVSAINVAENSIRNGTYGTAPNSSLRTLVTIDDGSVAIDTSKSTNLYVNFSKKISIASSNVNSNNAIIYWAGKVTIANGTTTLTVNSTTSGSPFFSVGDVISSTADAAGNAAVTFTISAIVTAGTTYTVSTAATAATAVTDRSASLSTNTLTVGSAGGNNINENHMSRPELLLACLSNSGTGYSSRYSSSVGGNNVYLCQRVGLTTEEPNGFIRLSVPSVVP
jgi:hypothetical protein